MQRRVGRPSRRRTRKRKQPRPALMSIPSLSFVREMETTGTPRARRKEGRKRSSLGNDSAQRPQQYRTISGSLLLLEGNNNNNNLRYINGTMYDLRGQRGRRPSSRKLLVRRNPGSIALHFGSPPMTFRRLCCFDSIPNYKLSRNMCSCALRRLPFVSRTRSLQLIRR